MEQSQFDKSISWNSYMCLTMTENTLSVLSNNSPLYSAYPMHHAPLIPNLQIQIYATTYISTFPCIHLSTTLTISSLFAFANTKSNLHTTVVHLLLLLLVYYHFHHNPVSTPVSKWLHSHSPHPIHKLHRRHTHPTTQIHTQTQTQTQTHIRTIKVTTTHYFTMYVKMMSEFIMI